jgi:hypothetical protein
VPYKTSGKRSVIAWEGSAEGELGFMDEFTCQVWNKVEDWRSTFGTRHVRKALGVDGSNHAYTNFISNALNILASRGQLREAGTAPARYVVVRA